MIHTKFGILLTVNKLIKSNEIKESSLPSSLGINLSNFVELYGKFYYISIINTLLINFNFKDIYGEINVTSLIEEFPLSKPHGKLFNVNTIYH
jgi:hypothetical protein